MSCAFTLYNHLGQAITNFNSALRSPEDSHNPSGGLTFLCELNELLLLPGRYRVNVAIYGDGELQDHIEGAAIFDVEEGRILGRPVPRDAGYGSVILQHRWILPR